MKDATTPMRRLLVFLHVVTSVGWMGQALAMAALLGVGLAAAADPPRRAAAFAMAEVVDVYVLLHLANAAAYTGLMLSALTAWGYFRHWWVLVKFVVTGSQLYLGIFVLSPNLAACVAAAARGEAGPVRGLLAGTVCMVAALCFQTWVSVAKPWSRTPWTGPGRLPTGPAWAYAVALAVPLVDYLVGRFVLGFPAPALALLTAVRYPVLRAVRLRRRPPRAGRPGSGATLVPSAG